MERRTDAFCPVEPQQRPQVSIESRPCRLREVARDESGECFRCKECGLKITYDERGLVGIHNEQIIFLEKANYGKA